jgi:hypothetical protein
MVVIVLCFRVRSCGQQFHIQCCIPPIERAPTATEVYYCFDCCKSGTSGQLAQYFQQHEDRKDEHERLVLQQYTSAPPTQKRKKTKAVVHSFVDTLLREDVAAESLERDPITGSVIKPKNVGGARARGKEEIGGDSVLLPISELEHLHHEQLIGKPIRLYCSNMNMYHNGRILDTRSTDDSIAALVRFPAGKDHRKATLTHWVYLEEHCLAVASDLVWAWMGNTIANSNNKKRSGDNAQWTPGKLWRRSGRELVPVMKLLDEEEGQIRFRPWASEEDGSKGSTDNVAAAAAKGEKDETELPVEECTEVPTVPTGPQWGLVESFDGTYELLNLSEETKPEPPGSGPKSNDPILAGMAKIELEEQRRIQWWKSLPLNDPSLALRAQDPSWPSLEFEMPVEKEYVRPASLVDLGLDREMILKLVSQRLGVQPTKDLGVSLACETTESLTAMVQSITP